MTEYHSAEEDGASNDNLDLEGDKGEVDVQEDDVEANQEGEGGEDWLTVDPKTLEPVEEESSSVGWRVAAFLIVLMVLGVIGW